MTKDSSGQRKRKHEEADEPAAGAVADRKAEREAAKAVGQAYYEQLQQARKNRSKTLASKTTSNKSSVVEPAPLSSQSSRSARSAAAASSNHEVNDTPRKRHRTDAGESKKSSEKVTASTISQDPLKMSSKNVASGAVSNKNTVEERQKAAEPLKAGSESKQRVKKTVAPNDPAPDRTPPRPPSSQRPPKAPFGSPVPIASVSLGTGPGSSQPKPLPRLPDGKSFGDGANLTQRPSYRHREERESSADPEAEVELSSTLRIQEQVNELQKLLLEEREQDESYNSEDDDFDDIDYDDDDDEIVNEDDGFPNYRWRRHGASVFGRNRWLLAIGGIVIIAMAPLGLMVYQRRGGDLWFWLRAAPKPHTCFMDNYPGEIGSTQCEQDSQLLPCPQGAQCLGGVIKSCQLSEFYRIDEKNAACILSEKANETIAAMVRKLGSWTVDGFCRPSAAKGTDSSENPLFSHSQLIEELELDENLALIQELSDIFVIKNTSDESVLIGLGPTIRVRIPLTCRLKRGVIAVSLFLTSWVLAFFWSVWRLFWGCLAFYWEIFEATPIVTLFTTVVLPFGFLQFRNRRLRKMADRRLELDIARVRERVYGCLSAVPERAVNTIDVRDQIVWSDYPMSKGDRKRAIDKVWPRVVIDIRQDNRIAKSFSMVNGTRRETWKWTAPVIDHPANRPNPVVRFQ